MLSPSLAGCVILGRLPDLSELPKMGKGLTPTLEPYQPTVWEPAPSCQLWGAPGEGAGSLVCESAPFAVDPSTQPAWGWAGRGLRKQILCVCTGKQAGPPLAGLREGGGGCAEGIQKVPHKWSCLSWSHSLLLGLWQQVSPARSGGLQAGGEEGRRQGRQGPGGWSPGTS